MNELIVSQAKSSINLSLADVVKHWVWVETESLENEDEIAPYICKTLPDSDWIYYLFARFELADGTIYRGYLRWSYGNVTFIAIAIAEKELAYFTLISEIRKSIGQTPESFAHQLNKKISSTFPLSYHAKVGFSNEPIQGQIVV